LTFHSLEDKSRYATFLAVVLFHGVLFVVLTRWTQLHFPSAIESDSLRIQFVPSPRPSHRTVEPQTNAIAAPARSRGKTDKDIATTDDATAPLNPMPADDFIDWTREADSAIQNGFAQSETEKHYRNLSGLSPSQLEWAAKMRPAPRGRDSPFELRNDTRCSFVGFVLLCQMKVGKRKARTDLFKNMREYLDERLTDPLP
jgi:hypothetical protein